MMPSKEAKMMTFSLVINVFIQEPLLPFRTIRKAGGGSTGPAKAFYQFYVSQIQVGLWIIFSDFFSLLTDFHCRSLQKKKSKNLKKNLHHLFPSINRWINGWLRSRSTLKATWRSWKNVTNRKSTYKRWVFALEWSFFLVRWLLGVFSCSRFWRRSHLPKKRFLRKWNWGWKIFKIFSCHAIKHWELNISICY
jgi:hypothetical protein